MVKIDRAAAWFDIGRVICAVIEKVMGFYLNKLMRINNIK